MQHGCDSSPAYQGTVKGNLSGTCDGLAQDPGPHMTTASTGMVSTSAALLYGLGHLNGFSTHALDFPRLACS